MAIVSPQLEYFLRVTPDFEMVTQQRTGTLTSGDVVRYIPEDITITLEKGDVTSTFIRKLVSHGRRR